MKTQRLARSVLTSTLLLSGIASAANSRTEVITYHDNTTKWVLGQTATVTCTVSAPASNACDGDVVSANTFDATTALPLTMSSFGKLQTTATYNADGTLATIKDGLNHATTFTNWKRGIPQNIQYADLTTQSAVVNDNGWITSVTDELGYTTCYGYDAMGRLTKIEYPNETSGACDTGEASWKKLNRSFVSVAAVEYGIPAGHWRETVTTGNATKITYYDGMWRPLLVREYDAGNQAATERFTKTAYDAEGRVSFAAYPVSTVTAAAQQAGDKGVTTFYDPLGRVTSVSQDSEWGLLTTTTTYNPGFTTTVTSPRGATTAVTTSYMAYDQPSTDWPLTISAPEGAETAIVRDAHGKPISLTRSGGGVIPVVRSYAYNGYQELCRSEEPEIGATLYGYDAAGNLASSAAGLPLGTACGTANTRTVNRIYDARNRLSTLAFPDGVGDQTWTYYSDGLPNQITTYNAVGNADPVVNAYTYNKRRLLTGENVSQPGYSWSLGYGYNTLGHLVTQAYPTGLIVNYAPNALGQATQAISMTGTSYASNASYYPNGAIKQFTYGNGIVHTMTQNARQLPGRSQDSAGVLNAVYNYDANGNVDSIIDELVGAGNYSPKSRWMTYDGLDRLTGAGAGMFGGTDNWHRFTYDTLDNLTSWKLAGAKDYATYTYSNNRPTSIQNTAGSSVVALTYDVQGNLSNKNGQGYVFDYGNRLRSATGKETYRYDANGRRVQSSATVNGTKDLFGYSQAGQMLQDWSDRKNSRSSYIYLGGSLVAKHEVTLGTWAEKVSYQHTDALGSPVATTNSSGAVVERTDWEPYGAAIGKTVDGIGYTGHVMDAATGLTYMQQRYYDPQCGCFLSVDPVAANPNTGASFNRYAYANNNPYKFKDPDGRQSARIESGATEEQRQAALDERLRRQGVGNRYTGQTPAAPAGSKTFGPLKSGYVPAVNNPAQAQRYQARSPENRTIQIGLKVSGTLGPIAIDVSAGVAGDARGNVALYSEAGGGAGARGDAYAGFTMHWTNARTVNDLAGQSYAGSAGGGFGPYVSGDASYSPGQGGSSVKGFGFTIGAGAGGGGSATVTETTIRPILED